MALTYIIILAAVQGVTEFLPISSSAHLILVRDLLTGLGMPMAEGAAGDQLAFDIALHVGTLIAVVAYFWRDVLEMIGGVVDGVTGRGGSRFRLLMLVIVGTIPIVIVGYLAKDLVVGFLRNTEIIAWTTIVFGLLLWVADRQVPERESVGAVGYRDALIVGLFQVVAIVPGVSRSGICMTAGRFLGFDRPLSARFASLLAIPTICAAGLLATYDLYQAGDANLTADALIGGIMAFVFALVAIALMMGWLRRSTYLPFVIYRLVLGLILLTIVYL